MPGTKQVACPWSIVLGKTNRNRHFSARKQRGQSHNVHILGLPKWLTQGKPTYCLKGPILGEARVASQIRRHRHVCYGMREEVLMRSLKNSQLHSSKLGMVDRLRPGVVQ